jgi:hypothetical protein
MARVLVTSAATLIVTGDGRFNVRNRSGVSIYLDFVDTVTTSTGYELGDGEAVGMHLDSDETLYGIAASGSRRVDVLAAGS